MYLKENAKDFYKMFQDYTSATSLAERFQIYSKMATSVFTDEYKKWTENDQVILKKDFSVVDRDDSVVVYLKSLME